MARFNKEQLFTLTSEVKMSEAINREVLLPVIRENLHRYIGDYVPRFGGDWDIMLNEFYPIIQNELPSIFFRNPRAFLKPRNKTYITKVTNPNTGKKEDVQMDSSESAKTQEDILNYSVLEMDYKKEARRVLLDALLFPYGVMWHGYKGDFGMTEEKSIFIKNDRSFVQRTAPNFFIHDPAVTIANLHEGKWVGRIIDVPRQELLEDDKLDVDKNKIKGFRGYGEKIGQRKSRDAESEGGRDYVDISSNKSLLDFTDDKFKKSENAKFVRVYEIYHRPSKKQKRKGEKGTIFLLTKEQDKPLRESAWNVKAEGFPSQILEFNELPDNLFGLDDFNVFKQAADQKNIVVNLQIRNAQENSKTWVGIDKQNNDEDDIRRIQQGENTILLFDGNPHDKMFVASAGGAASSELYLLDQRIQRNIEDKSGITDLKRGFLQSGEESAASVKIRNSGGAARPAYRQDIMAEFLKKSFHYLNQLNKQFVPYDEAVRIVGSLDLQWSRNPSKEAIQADTDVEIDVYSMLPENPQKELQELNNTLILMFQGLTVPEIKAKLEQEGKMINIAPLIEQILMRQKIRDPEVFRSIKPEESEGFVSVKELREANANVQAALSGQQVPFPPKEDDDHRVKLEVYNAVKELGAKVDILEQLIQVQGALLQKIQEKEANPGQKVQLPQPKVQTLG